jgi:hypothetical protein
MTIKSKILVFLEIPIFPQDEVQKIVDKIEFYAQLHTDLLLNTHPNQENMTQRYYTSISDWKKHSWTKDQNLNKFFIFGKWMVQNKCKNQWIRNCSKNLLEGFKKKLDQERKQKFKEMHPIEEKEAYQKIEEDKILLEMMLKHEFWTKLIFYIF